MLVQKRMKHSFCVGAFIGFALTCALSLLGGRDADAALLDALVGGLLFALLFRVVSGRGAGHPVAAASWMVTASPCGRRFAAATDPQQPSRHAFTMVSPSPALPVSRAREASAR